MSEPKPDFRMEGEDLVYDPARQIPPFEINLLLTFGAPRRQDVVYRKLVAEALRRHAQELEMTDVSSIGDDPAGRHLFELPGGIHACAEWKVKRL